MLTSDKEDFKETYQRQRGTLHNSKLKNILGIYNIPKCVHIKQQSLR